MTDAYKDKTVVVTGAAGGLGRAIAQAFLLAAANVVLVDVNPARLATCSSELSTQHPGRVLAIQANITDETAVKGMIDAVVRKFSTLDVLVNNAGIMDHYDPVGTLERNVWDRVIAVNLTAPMLTSKHAINQFLEQRRGGAILNVASTSAIKGFCAGE
jgi:NAD(P)-dependent dehydrogenase (short-subunit alcohol dehydrogenase family)